MKTNPNKLWILVFALGWLFDFLFWKMKPGVNFAIFATACLVVAFYLLLSDGLRPNRTSLILLPLFGFFAAVTFIRAEPMTTFLAYTFTLLMHDPARSDLSRRALVSVHPCRLSGQIPAIIWEHDRAPNHFYDRDSQRTGRSGHSTLQAEYLARGARHCDRPAHHRHLCIPARLSRCGLRSTAGGFDQLVQYRKPA